jgi:Rieske Fe-S protein
MTATRLIPVIELNVRCSYPMRPDVLAASDTCQHPADTAVRDAHDALWWRCPAHEGQLTLSRRGEVVTSVPRPVTSGGH